MNAYTNTRSLRQCASLAQASEYNLFILTNVEQRNSDIEGRAAVGGNALFSSLGIGSKLCNATTPCPLYGTDPTLVVGGNLIWDNGTNFSGNTIMTPSGSYNVTAVSYNNANSALQPIRRSGLNEDFESAFAYFRCAARQWVNFTSLPNTTTIINCYGNIFMIGLNQDINIFRINATQVAPTSNVIGSGNNTFDSISSLTIIAPDNSTILINVNGANIDFGNYAITRNTMVPATLPIPSADLCNQLSQGITPSEAQKKQIFWNFYNADTIVTSNSSFQGTVFAPYATIYTLGGNIEGSVIADGFLPYGSVANHTELHNYLFGGCLPVVNCPTYIPTTSCTSSTTTGCTSSSSTTTGCTSSSTSTTSCTYSSSTTTSCPTSSSTTTSCPTSSSTTTSCPTSSSTTSSCTCSSSSSTSTSHTTSSHTTSSCTTSSYTSSSSSSSSYTTSSSTTCSHTTWSHTTWSHTTWSHTTWTFTTPNTSSTTTMCPPRNIQYCPRCGRRTTTWRFNGRSHHYCFYCGYHYMK